MKVLLCLSLIVGAWHTISGVQTLDMYPWNKETRKERTDYLLQVLRDNVELDISEESMLTAMGSAALSLKDIAGDTWVARIAKEEVTGEQNDEDENDIFSAQILSSKLNSICAVLPSDYWNYEWCHRKEVSQFHIEPKGQHWVKDPSWSLGTYKRSVIVRDLSKIPSPVVKIVDYFEGGQICHENNKQRSVEVHLQCCDGLNVPEYTPSDLFNAALQREKREQASAVGHQRQSTISHTMRATFHRIQEPTLCGYTATICSPVLCSKTQRQEQARLRKIMDGEVSNTVGQDSSTATSGGKKPLKVFSDVIGQLLNLCILKAEEWWTYEFCFTKGVRQIRFNVEQKTSPEGTIVQTQVPVNQYLLGLPPANVYGNETALVERTKFRGQDRAPSNSTENQLLNNLGMVSPLFKTHEKEVNSLTLHFTEGTPCDLDNVNRSTIVELFCGRRNEIRVVREESTCQYRMVVDLVPLCTLPRFAPQKRTTKKIAFSPEDEFWQSIRSKPQKSEEQNPSDENDREKGVQNEEGLQQSSMLTGVRSDDSFQETDDPSQEMFDPSGDNEQAWAEVFSEEDMSGAEVVVDMSPSAILPEEVRGMTEDEENIHFLQEVGGEHFQSEEPSPAASNHDERIEERDEDDVSN